MKKWKMAAMLAAACVLGISYPCDAAVLQLGAETYTETVKTVDGGTYTGNPLHNIPAAYAEGEGAALIAENAAFTNGKFTAVAGGELSLKWGLVNSPISQINAKGGKISITDSAIRANGVWASDGGSVSITGGAVSGGSQSLISASAGGRVDIEDSGRVLAGGLHADGKGAAVRLSGVKEVTVDKIMAADGGRIELTGCEASVTGDVELASGAALAVKGGKLSIEGNLTGKTGVLEMDEDAEVTVQGKKIAGKKAEENAVMGTEIPEKTALAGAEKTVDEEKNSAMQQSTKPGLK